MNPTFFGSPPLFGIHHPPVRRGDDAKAAVLVCPPLGHEHTRGHRALRILSQALSRAGHHVLRFDYRGLGDSWGDTADGGVEQWCDDIDLALGELMTRSGATRVSLVGLRAGGILAAAHLARPRGGRPSIHRLILWDPVLSGQEFLRVACEFDAMFTNDPDRFPVVALAPERGRSREPDERLLGYAFPPPVRASLGRLDLACVDPWPAPSTAFVLSGRSAECEKLAERLRASGHEVECEVVEGADGAWEDYSQHEMTLRAGRLVSVIVRQATREAG